jgi:phytoene synthase
MIRAAVSPSLEQAYAHCRRLVAARAKNFLYAFLLLPGERRRALEAIYAYCRVADDFADDDALPLAERAQKLADLRARLRLHLPRPGEAPPELPPGDPELELVLLALGDAARRFGVSRDDLDLVAVGCEQDLTVTRYETFEELRRYCYLVASAVGLACLPVFGVRGDEAEARALAEDLGIAMQLTNIVRDVREDLARDRVYLPQEDLRRFGVSEDALRAGRADDAWRACAAFQVERARRYFARGRQLVPRVDRSARVCPLALASIYSALLDAIEAAGFDVFSARVSLSAARKLTLMGTSLGRAVLT